MAGLRKKTSPKVLAAIMLVIASVLAVSVYGFFVVSSDNVMASAVKATDRDAQIQVLGATNLLTSQLRDITNNLKILASSPAVISLNATQAQPLLDASQQTTGNITTSYTLVDNEGRTVASSNRTGVAVAHMMNLNLSQMTWFVGAKTSGSTYTDPEFFSVISKKTFIVFSEPIYSSGTKSFRGVLVSGINFNSVGSLVKSGIAPQTQSTIAVIDYNGTILYSAGGTNNTGKNVFGATVQSQIPTSLKDSLNNFLRQSLRESPVLYNVTYAGVAAAIASQQITYGSVLGKPTDQRIFGVAYIIAPSFLAASQQAQIGQLQAFTFSAIALIVAAAAISSWSFLRREKTLSKLVSDKTRDLRQQIEISDKHRKTAELMQDLLSHDIRNYNQVSQLSLELLRDNLTEGGRDKEEADLKLVDSALKAIGESSQLITRAKILGGVLAKEETSLRPVDLEASLKRSIDLVVKANPKRSISTSFKIEPNALVLADDLVDEVFTNLLSNSVNYTEADDVPVEVSVTPEDSDGRNRRGQFWKIAFTDHGKGIPDEVKADLFTRYLSTAHGTGLGLSIVHALAVDRYSGDVKVTDRVKGDYMKGTRMEVWLPRAPRQGT